jgi:hypothetical protein
MGKQVLLRINCDVDDGSMVIETDFTEDELDAACAVIVDSYDGIDVSGKQVMEELVKKGYIKIIGPSLEVYDIMF